MSDEEQAREIVAERLGWPPGAVEACRAVEEKHPTWYCWWTPGPWPRRGGPAYGAARIHRRVGDANLYADTPSELSELIAKTTEEEARNSWPCRFST